MTERCAVRLVVPAEQEDLASALLWEAGTEGLEVQAPGLGLAGAAVGDPPAPGWVALLAYFPARAGLIDELRSALAPLGVTHIVPTQVPEVDWVERFRAGFTAFEAGGFRIVPEWETPTQHDGETLRVDPGRAFGTGTHETTRLCLRGLRALAAERALGRVLDVGCGTGLLAVAAHRLGARWVVGVDNDPEAGTSARAHAVLNDCPLHVLLGDGGRPLRRACCDVLLANLMAPLLLARRDELLGLLAPGGVLLMSGLLVTDLPDVLAAYEPAGATLVTTDGEWAAVRLDRR
jgi:ribosomal protein L11 methyltransferase